MSGPTVPTDEQQIEQALVELVVRGMRRVPLTGPLESLVDRGLALVKGPIVVPAPGAEVRVRALLRLPAQSEQEAVVEALYETFLPINLQLREVCTGWQCRPDGSPNDHSDVVYDARLRGDLKEVHDRIAPVLGLLGAAVPRLARFRSLLDQALDRVNDGDTAWFASPLHDSYHTVWMHLHQELLFALGLSRAEDQARERQAASRSSLEAAVCLATAGVLSPSAALRTVLASDVDELMHPALELTGAEQLFVRGLPGSPGAASGVVVLSSEHAVELAATGRPVVLIAAETTPADLPGLLACAAVVTSGGGNTSHAAIVARGLGRPAVCGAAELRLDHAAGTATANGVTVHEGDPVSVDGRRGAVYLGAVRLRTAPQPATLATLLNWADQTRTLRVLANADTAQDAELALRNGAEGIGLCRTEHQFLGEQLPLIRRVILAADDAAEHAALDALARTQREDFAELLSVVGDRPVTVRLLDAPLHEFLPAPGHAEDAATEELAVVVREANPMLGVRGVRLAFLHERLYPAQAEALFSAWIEVAATGVRPHLEVMVPLVSLPEELAFASALINRAAADVAARTGITVPYRLGCMLETPRAALLAGTLARHADFLSFGTNDLTQLTYGFSRDDVERRLLRPYLTGGLLQTNPFATLDPDGVFALMEIAAQRARAARAEIKLGVCGEHAGDPASIELCARLDLDYVSCSPQRVPVARLAAAGVHFG